MGGAQSFEVIEPVIGGSGQPGGAVVDIEQDRIKSRTTTPDERNDVGFAEAHARIGQAVAEDRRHRTSGPGQDGRHQLGHDDPGIRSEHAERGAQREAHAQSADQYPRTRAGLNSLASHGGERRFGSAKTAVHQLVLTEPDREFGTTPHEPKLAAAARHLRGIDAGPGNHGSSCSG